MAYVSLLHKNAAVICEYYVIASVNQQLFILMLHNELVNYEASINKFSIKI